MFHPQNLAKPGRTTARSFFALACPVALALRGAELGATSGTVAFDVRGPGGGRWYLDLARLRLSQSAAPADLVLVFAPEAFERLLAREMSVAVARRDRALELYGDPTLLQCLAVLFAPWQE